MKKYLMMILMSLLIISCAKTKSDNIKTSGFYANYSVTGSQANTALVSCSASFQVESGGTYIDLSSGDSVTCNGQSMSRSELAGIVTYSASVAYQVGGTYEIVLTRTGESPYSSTVTLPEAVTGISPTSGSYSKGAQINYSWTPSSTSSDEMIIQFNRVTSASPSPCPRSDSNYDTSPEDGSGAFGTNQTALPSDGIAGACSMQIKWIRARNGTMSSGLNGKIKAYQSNEANITLN